MRRWFSEEEIRRHQRNQIYDSYCKELARYDASKYRSSSQVRDWCEAYLNKVGDTTFWLPITEKNKDIIEIGFAIITKLRPGEAFRAGIDYFVEQVYVLPQYRGEKFVSSVLNDFMLKHKGRYGFFVLKKNEQAKDFWCKFIDHTKASFLRLNPNKEPFSSHMKNEDELWGFKLA